MTFVEADKRGTRLQAKAREKRLAETAAELSRLEARPDYRPELGYFIDLFRDGASISAVARRVDRPVAALLCLQAPLELFHALGFHPFKIFSGSQAAGQVVASGFPAMMCPMLRSALGALELDVDDKERVPWIVPTTCDWVVKFPEMARLTGSGASGPVHWMELPRLKDSPRSRERWFREVAALADFLAGLGGRKLHRKAFLESIEFFQKIRQSFTRLIELRRAGRVPTAWFFLIAGSFFLDRPETWLAALDRALPGFLPAEPRDGRVFLAGSPIFFPNFKLPRLLDEAGLAATADDLCSSERIFPAHVAVDDPSEPGLLRALAESYHQGCLCPTFGDNERRVNNIFRALDGAGIQGVVFHVLKGCHPYDLESFGLESPLKTAGLKFIRLETDYAAEDSQNLLTRLEAFRRTLGAEAV